MKVFQIDQTWMKAITFKKRHFWLRSEIENVFGITFLNAALS